MTKKQKDAAFIAKLKTLQISTGKAGGELPPCPGCGGPADHPFKVEFEFHPPNREDFSKN